MKTLYYLFVLLLAVYSSVFSQPRDHADGQVTLYYFDFNDSQLPDGWAINDGFGDNKTWKFYHSNNYNMGYPFVDSLIAVNSAAAGSSYMDELLTTGFFDCSGGEDVYLKFANYFAYHNNSLNEVGQVQVRDGAGDSWSSVLTMTGRSYGPDFEYIDLTPYIGSGDSIQIRFHYYNARDDYYWLLDNLELYYECDDPDNDNFCSSEDNCPEIYNPYQEDFDNDGIGNPCDDCTDTDADGYGNPGYDNDCSPDNCPTVYNSNQFDSDMDGIGDACDSCTDADGDGFGVPGFPGNTCPDDNCAGIYNPGQEDADGDGIGDACDQCTDLDGDGFGDPGYPSNTCALDNCPETYNPDQTDIDQDGIGDSCDYCTDSDDDGYGDAGFPNDSCLTDNCPNDANPDQIDSDADGIGDLCDSCTDLDADGYGDPGYLSNTCAQDNCPTVYNPDQTDVDLDGIGDSCDYCTDSDDDGYGDPGFSNDSCQTDNCPYIANPDQLDSDSDGIGDLCDSCTDLDGDGYGDPGYPANTCALDNCPSVYNPDQHDSDSDDVGDLCDICPDHALDNCCNPVGLNQAPEITSETQFVIEPKDSFEYLPLADDPNCDGSELEIMFENLPVWCYDDNGTIFGIPDCDAANDSFSVIVSDGDLSDTAVVVITIDNSNQAPEILDTTTYTILRNGTEFSYYPDIYDPDDDTHTITYTQYPGWCFLTQDTLSGVVPDDTLIQSISLIVADDCNEDQYSFDVELYVCGDANHDGTVDVSDAVFVINFAFGSGPLPRVPESGDANCDEMVDISDAVYILNFTFGSGPLPCANCPE